MPMNMSRYPADWDAISLRIRDRAKWKCEKCSAPNGVFIRRLRADKAQYVVWTAADEAANDPTIAAMFLAQYGPPVRVVLTVHHIGVPKPDGTPGDPHDKMDVRDENLIALCNRCHLLADLPIHMANAAATRARQRAERRASVGQLSFWEMTP